MADLKLKMNFRSLITIANIMYFTLMSLAGLGIGLTHESIDSIQLGTMVGVAVLLLYIFVVGAPYRLRK